MQVPPEVTIKGVAVTPYTDKIITRGIAQLEKACDYIISTRIALERAQGRRRTSNPYRMRIDISIPNRPEIVVKHTSKALKKIPDGIAQNETAVVSSGDGEMESTRILGRSSPGRRGLREEALNAFIRRTFDSARRQLEKEVQKQHGEIKVHAQTRQTAVVERIFRDDDYGFLRSTDGQQVYFHRNSLLHRHWDNLKVGTLVSYTPEMGNKGLQASTVETVEKVGGAEQHPQLPDLPKVTVKV